MLRPQAVGSSPHSITQGSSKYLVSAVDALLKPYSAHLAFTLLDEIIDVLFGGVRA
jgi:hypothetical protein